MDNLREAQIKMTQILDFVKNFCEENKIEYWLDYGTLLGAVRHNGFIPWDDDIDLGMDRKNYEKFYELFPKELSEKNSLYYCEKLKKDYLKIRVKENYLLKKDGTREEMNIDIFPYDYYDKKIINLLNKQCYYQNLKIKNKKTLGDKIRNIFIRLQRKYYKNILKKKLEYKINKGTFKEVNRNSCMGLGFKTEMKIIVTYPEIIFPLKNLEFEGKNYSVPNNYSEYLTSVYGEYMKLPPLKDRHGHSDVTEYILK